MIRSDPRPDGPFPQTKIVEELLEAVRTLLEIVPESAARSKVASALKSFRTAVVPAAIDLNDVMDQGETRGAHINIWEAADLVLDAAEDLCSKRKESVERIVIQYLAETE